MSQDDFGTFCNNLGRFGTEKPTKNLDIAWFPSNFAIVIYLRIWSFLGKIRKTQIDSGFIGEDRLFRSALYFISEVYRLFKTVCIEELFSNSFQNYFWHLFCPWKIGKSTNLLKVSIVLHWKWEAQIQFLLRPIPVLLNGPDTPETSQIV